MRHLSSEHSGILKKDKRYLSHGLSQPSDQCHTFCYVITTTHSKKAIKNCLLNSINLQPEKTITKSIRRYSSYNGKKAGTFSGASHQNLLCYRLGILQLAVEIT